MNGNGDKAQVGHGRRITDWTYQYTFSWWSDGTSKQLCFAEKFIPCWAYNEPYLGTNGWDIGHVTKWDSGFQAVPHNAGAANTARIVSDNVNLKQSEPNQRKR